MAQSFIFGGNTNLSYDQIQKQRDIANELLRANMYTPQNVGEGLAAIGRALAAKAIDKRTGKAEAEGRRMYEQERDQTFAMLGGYGGSQPASAPVPSAAPATPAQSVADDTMSALGKTPMRPFRDAIASIESAGSGNYAAVGPTHPKMGRALGRYQIMEANIGPWSKEVLGREVTPDEFIANPQLQDAIFDGKFGQYVQQFGPEGAAQAWFAGPGGVGKMDRQDVLGTSVADYTNKFTSALGGTASAAPAGQPAGGMADPAVLMALADVAGNPYASESDKMIAKLLMDQTAQSMDPMRALEREKAQLEIEALRNPQPEYTQLSAQEVAQLGLPPGVYQRGPDGRIDTVEKTQAPADPIAELRARATAAGLQEGSPEFQAFMLSGGKQQDGMVIESDGQGGFRMVQGAGAAGAAAKPFTEAQSKDVVYATRAKGALEALDPIANALTSRGDVAAGYLPFGLGGGLQNEQYQVAKTAGDEFLQAILRKDTGAAITADEQALYGETYLPQPGDNEARLAYKAEARQRAVAAIEAGMSPAQIIAQEKALAEQAGVAEPAAPAPKQDAAAGPTVADIGKMTMQELLRIDVNTLSDEQMDAMMKRFDEVNK